MIEIIKTQALVRDVNLRAEIHGDETVVATDISLEFSVSNQKLKLLDPGLLASLYKLGPNADSSSQESLDIEEGHLPHLRYPHLTKFPWAYEGEGYEFQLINDSLHGDQVISIPDCKLKRITVELQDGGTIKLRCQVQGHPSTDVIGELCDYIKAKVPVSLIPPKVDEDDGQQELADAA